MPRVIASRRGLIGKVSAISSPCCHLRSSRKKLPAAIAPGSCFPLIETEAPSAQAGIRSDSANFARVRPGVIELSFIRIVSFNGYSVVCVERNISCHRTIHRNVDGR